MIMRTFRTFHYGFIASYVLKHFIVELIAVQIITSLYGSKIAPIIATVNITPMKPKQPMIIHISSITHHYTLAHTHNWDTLIYKHVHPFRNHSDNRSCLMHQLPILISLKHLDLMQVFT